MHLELTPGPAWFSGPDFILDVFGMIILLMIGFFAWRFYKINENKKHLMMFTALAVLGASFVFKIITYFILYLTTFKIHVFQALGQLIYYMEPNNFYFSISFILYSVLTLVGFYLLYTVYEPKLPAKTTIFILYLLLVIALFTENAYLFLHLTAMFLSALITISLWGNYRNNKLGTTRCLAVSFGILTVSRVFFILASIYSSMYVLGELVQFGGYALLLLTFIRVLKDGKKTRKAKNN